MKSNSPPIGNNYLNDFSDAVPFFEDKNTKFDSNATHRFTSSKQHSFSKRLISTTHT